MIEHPPAQKNGAANAHLDDETLSAHLDAELAADEVSAAARHLEACSSCRDRLRSLSRAAQIARQPVAPVSPATRQQQLERALEVSPIRDLPGSARRARRQLVVARWAAAVLVVAGGGAAVWRFRSDLSGASSTSAMASTTTQEPAGGAGRPAMAAPTFQLRILQGRQFKGCTPPSSSTLSPAEAPTLYDASGSAASGARMCAPLGAVVARLNDATRAHFLPTSHSPVASLILSVPGFSAGAVRSLLLEHRAEEVAVVFHDEVIGYLSTSQGSDTVTILRVPAAIASEVTAALGSG